MSDVASLKQHLQKYETLKQEISKIIVGQDAVIEQILISIFSGGHSLLVGVPGLAKTLMINTIAKALGLDFKRIQFTPDLMPSDILGSEILDNDRQFKFIKGPIFSNIILAYEINRTPPKTQAALLEAMQERSVTIAGHHYKLDAPYFVLATQNPIEQEGTYPLPEAQLDRFLMHLEIDYPGAETELEILRLTRNEAMHAKSVSPPNLRQSDILDARQDVLKIHLDEALEQYIVQLIIATRQPQRYDADLANWIEFGASPRATIALDKCARAHAWLMGRDFVGPDNIQAVFHNVLRHRLLLSYEAEAEGVNSNQVLDKIMQLVPVP